MPLPVNTARTVRLENPDMNPGTLLALLQAILLSLSVVVPTPVAVPETSTEAGIDWSDDIRTFFSAAGSPASLLPGEPPDGMETAARTIIMEPTVRPLFGTRGDRSWFITGGMGKAVDDTDDRMGFIGGGTTRFLDDNLSIDFEYSLVDYRQEGPDAFGGSFNLIWRWHFHARRSWTIYADGGVGLALSSEDVPQQGSSWNFTPQIGLGCSLALADGPRLRLGCRLQHLSNADTYHENTGRESLVFYGGLVFPF